MPSYPSSVTSPSASELTQSPNPSSCEPDQKTLVLTSLSWNIEGIKRNLFSLKNLINKAKPDFIFLSEHQIFSSDLAYCMSIFKGEYSCELNSEDKTDDATIAMSKSRAKGGTMAMWKKSLDQHISIHRLTSTSFLPLVFSPPGCPVSVHFAIYLPTSGREADFLDQISQLSNCIDELNEKYEDCLVFIRGDGNVNSNNIDRMRLLKAFLNNHSLMQV